MSYWLSAVLGMMQLMLLIGRYLERARVISEADVLFTARLHLAARELLDAQKTSFDDAAARANDSMRDPFEKP